MQSLRSLLAGALVPALSLAIQIPSATAQQPGGTRATGTIAFVNATVIPMDRERTLPGHTVVVTNGEIVQVGPSSRVNVPADAVRVDATGRYLLPALADMHVHLLGESWNMMLPPEARSAARDVPYEDFLFPYLANGVTILQDLSATMEDLGVRQRIARGELLGPRIILAPMIDGPGRAWPPPLSRWVATADEARQAVLDADESGFDKIKVYSFLSRESYDAIITTAREVEMDVIGHIPNALSVEYVLDAGQKLIAHTEEVAKHAGGDYSPERIEYYAGRMADRGVWLVPTLVTTQSILDVFDDPQGALGRPEAAYFQHPMERGVWSFLTDSIYRPIPAGAQAQLRDAYVRFQGPLTRSFHRRGGRILVGTDSPWPGLVPGFALHRELVLLVANGLTPYEALRAATTLPFEYLDELDRAGTVEVGKHSDLILVDEDPLQDISGASKISGVLVRGRWLGADEIRRRMDGLAARAPASHGHSHAEH